jgi:hypothetical protein
MGLGSNRLTVFDLGVTTGWASFADDDWEPAAHGNFPVENFELAWEQVILLWGLPQIVVVEKPIIVRGNLGTVLEGLLYTANKFLSEHNVVEVEPSEWKPHPIGSSPCPRGLTPHERDAIRMGRWYIATRLEG